MQPATEIARSYTIWFSQRTGSTWFAGLLEGTGTAGIPREHLNFPDAQAAVAHYGATAESLAAEVRAAGTGTNGVFGIKHSFRQPAFDSILESLTPHSKGQFGGRGRLAAWEQAFPEHRHIFITRRNKVRLAVSWWRAIQSGEWHRKHGAAPASDSDLSDAFDFWAIDHLLNEAVMREAGIAELFARAGVAPLTLAYKDIVLSPEQALRLALDHLGLAPAPLPATQSARLADELSEEWAKRYRKKKQRKWTNRGW